MQQLLGKDEWLAITLIEWDCNVDKKKGAEVLTVNTLKS